MSDNTGCMVAVQGLPSRIVVGVTDSAASRDAVLWAAEEARIRRLTLVITHIEPAMAVPGPESSWGTGHGRLSGAAAAASQHEPGIAVGTLLLIGDVAGELIELSRSAAVVVVGVDRSQPGPPHNSNGQVADRIVAHAGCPIVTISCRLPVGAPSHGHIIVGWAGDAYQPTALKEAATEAEARAATLTVVADRRDRWLTVGDRAATQRDQFLDIDLGILASSHPQLTIELAGAAPDLAASLQRLSGRADLLLAGCEQSGPWDVGIGDLARRMTQTADCPVMLVPAAARADRHSRPAA